MLAKFSKYLLERALFPSASAVHLTEHNPKVHLVEMLIMVALSFEYYDQRR